MESTKNTWSVIKFPDEDAVSAVPTSWITEGNKCYWPPYTKNLLIAAIEKNDTPDNVNWQKYACIGFRNNVFDTYREASKKAMIAMNSSDLESDDNSFATSSRNRKIFKKTYSFSSVEECEDISVLPCPPKPKKHNKEPTKPSVRKNNSQKELLDDHTNLVRTVRKSPDNTFEDIQGDKSSKERQKVTLLSERVDTPRTAEEDKSANQSKKILNYLEQIVRKQNILQSLIMDVSNRLSILETNHVAETVNNTTSIFTLLENLPINTVEDLDILENFLSDEEQMQNTITEISYLGGKTIYEFVFRATQKLITNRFCGAEYSFIGKRQKKSFQSLKLKDLLTKAAMKLFKNATVKDVEVDISKWVRRCSERAKKENNGH